MTSGGARLHRGWRDWQPSMHELELPLHLLTVHQSAARSSAEVHCRRRRGASEVEMVRHCAAIGGLSDGSIGSGRGPHCSLGSHSAPQRHRHQEAGDRSRLQGARAMLQQSRQCKRERRGHERTAICEAPQNKRQECASTCERVTPLACTSAAAPACCWSGEESGSMKAGRTARANS